VRRASIASAYWPHSWAARCHDEPTKRIREAIEFYLAVGESCPSRSFTGCWQRPWYGRFLA